MAEGISGLSTSFQVSRITVPNLCIALRQYNTSTMRIESLLYFVRERVRKMERESVPDHWAEILLHESYPNEMSLLGSVLIPFQDCELLRTAASHYQFCGPTRTRMENAGIRPVSQILNQAVHLEVCSMNLNPAQKEIREEIQGWVEGWIQSDLIVPTRNFILLFHGPSRRQSISSSPLSSLYTLASGEGYISRQGSSPSLHGQSPQHLSNALQLYDASMDTHGSSVSLSRVSEQQGPSIAGPSLYHGAEVNDQSIRRCSRTREMTLRLTSALTHWLQTTQCFPRAARGLLPTMHAACKPNAEHPCHICAANA